MRTVLQTALILGVAATAMTQTPAVDPKSVGADISIANIEQTLEAIDIDRTAASQGEYASADYIDRKLTEYGVAHRKYNTRQFLSWPGAAELDVSGVGVLTAKTAAFAGATPAAGVSGVLMIDPALTRRVDQSLAFGPDVRGRIPVVHGIEDTEALVLAGERAGAVAVVQIDATDTLHEDIVTTIWGTPTPQSAARIPSIPFVTITRSDGDRLRAAAKRPLAARVKADVRRGWRDEPVIVADVAGRSPDFVLIATHLDAWYHGMTDTGGSDASILEMARVLQRHRAELARGIRFAWWTGHSFGRYAGSTWYVDHFWGDLDQHCVAYTNLDGPGRRGSRLDAVSANGWPGLAEYARESAARISGRTPAGLNRSNGARPFRPGRDSDSSFQGLGIPFFSIGVPGPPRGNPDIDTAGRVAYWHAADDTLDKIDPRVLQVDTGYRVAQLYDLATMKTLPHLLEPIAASYVAALKDLASASGGRFDLTATLDLATALDDAAARFDKTARAGDPDAFNTLVVRLTHQLNSTLYTRAGRFDQDPAAAMPVLPLLARVRDLPAMAAGDDAGFLETGLLRGRNAVEASLRDALQAIRAALR
jgi:N-acetylated-alpha-linked acidic dipeptidase